MYKWSLHLKTKKVTPPNKKNSAAYNSSPNISFEVSLKQGKSEISDRIIFGRWVCGCFNFILSRSLLKLKFIKSKDQIRSKHSVYEKRFCTLRHNSSKHNRKTPSQWSINKLSDPPPNWITFFKYLNDALEIQKGIYKVCKNDEVIDFMYQTFDSPRVRLVLWERVTKGFLQNFVIQRTNTNRSLKILLLI